MRRSVFASLVVAVALVVGMSPALAANRVWLRAFTGGSNNTAGRSVAVDPSNGHVYVLTVVDCCLLSTIDTVAYDANGTRLWTVNSGSPVYDDPMAITVDATTHDVLITGRRKKSMITQAYSAGGNVLWTMQRKVTGHELHPVGIVSDGHGRVVVAASTWNESSGTTDFLTIAYRISNGDRLWYRNYGPSNSDDTPVGIAADPVKRQVYVVGSTMATNFFEMVTVAYATATGDRPWIARDVGGNDTPVGVAVDTSNHNVFAVSDTAVDVLQWDTFAYSSAGAPRWHATYENPLGSFNASPEEVAADPGNGRVYVYGSQRTSTGGTQNVLVGYSSSGAQEWTNVHDDGANGFPRALTVDPANHRIYTASDRTGASGDSITITRGVSVTGDNLWNDIHSSPVPGGIASPVAIAADASHAQVYVTGEQSTDEGGADAITIGYHA